MTKLTHIQLGRNIRRMRKKAGLKRSELGDAIGSSAVQVMKYEAGANSISAIKLFKIAKALNCSTDMLFVRVEHH